jgi:UDP-hydrolysing UDP-N-acetyl-D-glucosamine 2-epimerase
MRKIAVFTGTRAEYGLLYWIIKMLHESPKATLQLMVGGMHLSHEFGYTIKQIEEDGFPIIERMEFLLASDSPVAISKSMGLAMIGAAEALERIQPDVLVVLGDRFESMAIAQAAMIARVPIAHIHGGETTEGLIDEAIRHSITKMAHLHFTSTEEYRDRVIQLGEQPERVFNYGAPGIDNIFSLPLLSLDKLSESIDFDLHRPYFLVTYHPVTLSEGGASHSLENLLNVLDGYEEYRLVISYPNADTSGRKLIEILEAYNNKAPHRVFLAKSLGQLKYLSLMKYCDAVLGNSSSGLIEAPAFGVPTLNVGSRQKGRLSGDTVINCDESFLSISHAMERIVNFEFRDSCRTASSPYGLGGSSQKIVAELVTCPLDNILEKVFYDLRLEQ